MQSQPPVQPAERPLEQRQQRDAHHDLGRDQRKVQRSGEQREPRFHKPYAHSVPAMVERMVATTAMITLFQVASGKLRVLRKSRDTNRSEKPSHTVKRDELKLNTARITSGKCRNSVDRRGVERQPALHTRPSRSRRSISSTSSAHQRHQPHRNGRAERPVARVGELVLHQVADQHGAAAAQQVGRQVRAQARE